MSHATASDNFWTSESDRLYSALTENPRALVAHLLSTASGETIANIAGRQQESESNVFQSTLAVLRAELSR